MVDSPTGSRGGGRTGRIPPRSQQARTPLRARRRSNGAERTFEACPPEEAPGVRTLITRARSSLLTSFDTELEPFGVTGAQFEVLKNLVRSDNETAASLCRALHYDTGSMTRMLDRLQEKGLVSRARHRRSPLGVPAPDGSRRQPDPQDPPGAASRAAAA